MRQSRLTRGAMQPAGRMAIGIVLFAIAIFLQTLPFNEQLAKQELIKLFDINIPVIVGTIGLVFLLWAAVETFYTSPLWKIINERNNAIEKTFSEAEDLRKEMSQMKSDYEQRLASTEAKAREEIQASIREAQELRKTLMADAQAKADDMVRQAQEQIEAERVRALTDIRVHVANLSLQATEKILAENMDNERNRKLIDDFLSKVEAKN
ncbi:MAG: F0F1 ATP synthase subunit B [Fimbriimonadaceae bacterium]|nr:F0F1 ATP synthase subunit B [Fimbriimonadaceae bacterium]